MHMLATQLAGRLAELRGEFEGGQKALYACQTRELELKETLLRISGAIQVLEEELAKADAQAMPQAGVPHEVAQHAMPHNGKASA